MSVVAVHPASVLDVSRRLLDTLERAFPVRFEAWQFQVLLSAPSEQVARGAEQAGTFARELLDERDQSQRPGILRFRRFIQSFQIVQYQQCAPPS